MSRATAVAHSNIALVKYWGKADVERNLPAVPSLSMTLAALFTKTTVAFDPELDEDTGRLGDRALEGRPLERVRRALDRVRALAGIETRASVESLNSFPTASGLASSASGFAALVVAAAAAARVDLSPSRLSSLAREASVSAARSVFGGFVCLEAGAAEAVPLASADHLDVSMIVAVTTSAEKSVSSTAGMLRTAETSPYYGAWITASPLLYESARRAIVERDVPALGAAMEKSTLLMHASMFGADPAIIYLRPASLAVIECTRELRASGIPAYFTMDAGPHVKVLTPSAHTAEVSRALREVQGVETIIVTGVGPDAHVVPEEAA